MNWFLVIALVTPTGEVQTTTAGALSSERACLITAATVELEPYAPEAVKTVSECVCWRTGGASSSRTPQSRPITRSAESWAIRKSISGA
jgi:hypothetical protein